jgi:butyryl-CoA dehydrogenase
MFRQINKLNLIKNNVDKWILSRSISNVQNINLSDTHLMLKNTCKEFVDKEIIPKAHQIDKTSVYPVEIIKKMGELGLMAIDIPEKYEGTGLDYLAYVITMEEISRGCASCGVIMSAHNVNNSEFNCSSFFLIKIY